MQGVEVEMEGSVERKQERKKEQGPLGGPELTLIIW